jgi:transposase-like protein
MPRGRRPYAPEFRAEAVQLYRSSDKSLKVIASELGVSLEALRTWVKRAEIDEGTRAGLTTRGASRAPGAPAEGSPARAGARHLEKSHRLLRTGERDRVSTYRFIAVERATHDVTVLCRQLWGQALRLLRLVQEATLSPRDRRPVAHHQDPRDPRGLPRHLRGDQDHRRAAARTRGPGLAQARGSAHESRSDLRCAHPQAPVAQGSGRAGTRPGPRGPSVRHLRTRSGLRGRHHLRFHRRRLAAPGGDRGPVQPSGRGMVDGTAPSDRARDRRARDGDREPAPGPRARAHHSDQGAQFTSFAFGRRLREAGSCRRWEPWAPPTTTPSPRASSRRSSGSSSIGVASGPGMRPERRSSNSSRSSTTGGAGIPRSGCSRRPSSRGTTLVPSRHSAHFVR